MNQSQREMPRDLQHAPDAAPRPAPTVAPEPGSVEASQAIASVSLLPAPRDDEEQEAARAAKAVCEDLLLPEGQSIKELLQMVPLQIPDDSKTQTNLQRLARRLRPQRPPREGNLPVLLTPNMNEAMASVMDEHLVNVSYVSAYSQNHFEKVVETGPLRRFAEACENGAETAEEQAAHEFWSKIVKLYTIRSTARSEHHQFAEVVGTKWLDENKALYESFYTRVSVNTMELQRLFFLNYIETAKRIGWECLDTQGKPMPADVPEAYLNHLEKHIKVRRAILKATLWRLAGRQNELTLDEKQTADRIISDQDLTQTPGGTPLPPFEARMFTAGWTPRKG
ncbi:hypothetical protein TGMAS_314550 [Toxoplasma gondii MAS]|uniref:Uncharacterized protein n=1 Tax=Toxoplasma gondii MAS TaxID=943118 RepID=A0A086QYH6_TOXGO|nr:hypothetical protein TGMAS_314550 [Toxoplasma gondii MAS]